MSQKLNHLDVGEFVLLLPEHLRSEEEHYKSVFEDDLTSRMSSQDERQQMTATVGYLESGQDRFVYNTTPYFLPAVFERSNHHCYNTPINWSTVHFVLDRRSTELRSL